MVHCADRRAGGSFKPKGLFCREELPENFYGEIIEHKYWKFQGLTLQVFDL